MNCLFRASADGALRSGDALTGRWRARLDRREHLNESFLVPVAKKRGVEVGALRNHEMPGARLPILVDLHVGDVAEDVGRFANLAGLAQRHAKRTVVPPRVPSSTSRQPPFTRPAARFSSEIAYRSDTTIRKPLPRQKPLASRLPR